MGGGGLVSTSADYHRFCAMLLNRGELSRPGEVVMPALPSKLAGRALADLITAEITPGPAFLEGVRHAQDRPLAPLAANAYQGGAEHPGMGVEDPFHRDGEEG